MFLRSHGVMHVALVLACLLLLDNVDGYIGNRVGSKLNYDRFNSDTALSSSIIQILKEKFRPQVPVEIKTDGDIMLEQLQEKPWRASKVKNLKVVYRPWKDGWMERYRAEDDDSIYLYTINENKRGWDKTRADEVWHWPWMWTKVKTERLSWIMKVFGEDVDAVTVQEHMEIDNFFSEFDLPVRWGILRVKELDVLNVIALNTVFFTDFNGVRPTDLGLRPDGSVKTCSVQFANCISSSNSPGDTDHYAPPFKWSRSKSPDQAYDEIKEVYMKYPKRGLKWSSGWIDRGGWKPQEFGGPYFHAQAESQAWHYTDDIELVLDVGAREVQYRSSTRIGQRDWDVQRLRYNQFARMLEKKGGWDIQPMERLNWYLRTPFRWSELMSDKAIDATERTADRVLAAVNGISSVGGGDGDGTGGTRRAIQETVDTLQPYVTSAREYLQPFNEELAALVESLGASSSDNTYVKMFMQYEQRLEGSITELRSAIRGVLGDISHSASETLQLYEDPVPMDSPNAPLRESIDKKNSLLRGLFSPPTSSAPAPSAVSDSAAVESSQGTVGGVQDMTTGSSGGGGGDVGVAVDLDQASEMSRMPWTQSASPFSSPSSSSGTLPLPLSPTSTAGTVKPPAVLTSSEVNGRRRAKAAESRRAIAASAATPSTSSSSGVDGAEEGSDVEWIVDAYNADAPDDGESASSGISSTGRVNRRRQQQQLQQQLLQQQNAPKINQQESRIMKSRLDELRKAYGMYVSDGTDEAVEKKLIDHFK